MPIYKLYAFLDLYKNDLAFLSKFEYYWASQNVTVILFCPYNLPNDPLRQRRLQTKVKERIFFYSGVWNMMSVKHINSEPTRERACTPVSHPHQLCCIGSPVSPCLIPSFRLACV